MSEEKLDRILEISTDTRVRVAKIEERVQDIPILWAEHRHLMDRVGAVEQTQNGIKVRLAIVFTAIGAAVMTGLAWLKSHLFGGN